MPKSNLVPASILIVDDEIDIREILQINLEYEGFCVDLASSAEEGLEILTSEHKLILLDVMMEGMSGFKMADCLRKEGNEIPIIFLTARNTENDMLTGFSVGGDDFIAKPFSVKEVIARVKNVLKRTNKQPDESEAPEKVSSDANLMIYFDSQKVLIDGKSVDLTKTEFDILSLFYQNEGRIFTREDILNRIWKNQYVIERTVDVHIARLRKKLGEYGKFIVNRNRYGYLFISEKTKS